VVVVGLLAGYVLLTYHQWRVVSEVLDHSLPTQLGVLREVWQFEGRLQRWQYYDEIAAQSLRNYALTGEKQWQERYQEARPSLEAVALELGVAEASEARRPLQEIEERANQLVAGGNRTGALAVLEAEAYARERGLFQQSVLAVAEAQEGRYQEAWAAYTASRQLALSSSREALVLAIILTGVAVVLVTMTALLLSRAITQPLSQMKDSVRAVAAGNELQRVAVTSADEIGELAAQVNVMTEQLLKTREEAEATVAAIPEPVIVVNQAGVITAVNTAALQLLEYRQEELVGKSLTEVARLPSVGEKTR